MEKLHRVTWLMIIAGGLGLLANLVSAGALQNAMGAFGAIPWGMGPAADAWARVLIDVTYSLGFFATAAMVELLVRLLQELRAVRAALEKSQGSSSIQRQ